MSHYRDALDQAAIVITTDPAGLITSVNERFCQQSQYERSEVIGKTVQLIRSDQHPKPFFAHLWRTIAQGKVWRGEICNRAKDGSHYWVDTTIVPFLDSSHQPYQYFSIQVDITQQKRETDKLQSQHEAVEQQNSVSHEIQLRLDSYNQILRLIADGSPLSTTLEEIVGVTEILSGGVVCSLMLMHPRQGTLHHESAPSLDEEFAQTMDGLPLSPHGGACSAAAYNKEIVIVEDITRDPHGMYVNELALRFGLKACWARPVLSGDRVLAVLAMYYTQPQRPSPRDKVLMSRAVELIKVALERSNTETALKKQLQQTLLLGHITQEVRQSLDAQEIFQTAVTKLRRILNVDRVSIYRFKETTAFLPVDPPQAGECVAEDVLPPYSHARGKKLQHFNSTQSKGSTPDKAWQLLAFADIYDTDLSGHHLSQLESLQVRALITAPLEHGGLLWGLLSVHQCSGTRQWQASELNFVREIAAQLSVAIQQSDLLEQAEQKSLRLRQLLSMLQDQKQRQAELITALKQAKKKADTANQAKSAFLASMSHELRTPLNAILGFSQLMRRDTSLSDQQKDTLDTINRSGAHLLTLINDILEMSKIEAGRLTLNREDCNIHRLLDAVYDMFRLKAKSQGLKLLVQRSADVPQYLETDGSKLRQVLINLVGNGIKFTERGQVELHCWLDENADLSVDNPVRIWFEVKDTGLGITPEELKTIFDPFTQTESGRRSQDGTGLGLPISKKFVNLLGGDIRIDSLSSGGTCARFSIKGRFLSQPSKAEPILKQVLHLAPGQPSFRLLIAEDQEANQCLLVQLLESVGFQVRIATNGQAALEQWQEWKPHLIWMDLQMPVMDGYAATAAIRAKEGKREQDATKIIALTANAFEETRNLVLAEGFDDFVRKPFEEPLLFDKIRQHLGVSYLYEKDPMGPVSYDRNNCSDQKNISQIDASSSSQVMVIPPPEATNRYQYSLEEEALIHPQASCSMSEGIPLAIEHYVSQQTVPLQSHGLEDIQPQLKAMPLDWIKRLHAAALTLDESQLKVLIEEINPRYLFLSEQLWEWCQLLRFDRILEKTQPLLETPDETASQQTQASHLAPDST